ncbi:uncharacterized protein EV420DRAFT_1644738 [Desarmillaria tabescens]|uniref:C2H2-type domain-containing protein n=1 Tax=Armillaria tabescens TaxID=1929756 RepID=A0AA39N2G5_ARMTA|nr:uncharacterized protein EV420DRAFT_1644738 [Desarmillaria tabescens]KAK0455507.1 hypothetical protein EV420DRAFT_1644738 [Desarmillaria tabescens]
MYSQPRTQSSDTRYTLNGYSSADHEVPVDSNAAYSMNGSYYDQQNGVGRRVANAFPDSQEPYMSSGVMSGHRYARDTSYSPTTGGSRSLHPHSSSRRPLKWLTIRNPGVPPIPGAPTACIPSTPYSRHAHYQSRAPTTTSRSRSGSNSLAHYRHGHHSPNLSPHVPHRTPAAAAGIVAPERFVCQICKKSFSRSHDRKRHHVGQHLDSHARPVCPNCHKDFSRPDSLKRHRDNGCDESVTS